MLFSSKSSSTDLLAEIPAKDKPFAFAVIQEALKTENNLPFYDRESVGNIALEIGEKLQASFSSPLQICGLIAGKINTVLSQGGAGFFEFDDAVFSIRHKNGAPIMIGRNNPRPLEEFSSPVREDKRAFHLAEEDENDEEVPRKVSLKNKGEQGNASEQMKIVKPKPQRGFFKNSASNSKNNLSGNGKREEKISPVILKEYEERFVSAIRKIRKMAPLEKTPKIFLSHWLGVEEDQDKLKKIIEYLIEQKLIEELGNDMIRILIPDEKRVRVL